jgi:hypothetical protein
MKVLQLVGRFAGQIIDLPYHEAQNCLACGTAADPEKTLPRMHGLTVNATKEEPPAPPAPPQPVDRGTPILVNRSPSGALWLGAPWPTRTSFPYDQITKASDTVSIQGTKVTLTFGESKATYERIAEVDDDGAKWWVCELVSFEGPINKPEPTPKPAAAPKAKDEPKEPKKRGRGRPPKAAA